MESATDLTAGTKRSADEIVVGEENNENNKRSKVNGAESGGDGYAGSEYGATTPVSQEQQIYGEGHAVQNEVGSAAVEPEPPLPEGLDRGIVKWFDIKKGYGFITRDQGEDVFVHQTCLKNKPGYKGLAEQEIVWFKTYKEDSGRLRALEVTAPGGGDAKAIPDPEFAGAMVGLGGEMSAPGEFPKHTDAVLAPGRLRGCCKWFNVTKGFGFITPEDNSGDVFVHQSQIYSQAMGPGRSLADGENVEYEISPEEGDGKAKKKASNVTGPGGAYVVGATIRNPMGAYGGYGMMDAYGGYGGSAQAQYAQYYQQQQQQQSQYAQYAQYYQQQQQGGQGQSSSSQSSSSDPASAYAAYYQQYYAAAAAAAQGNQSGDQDKGNSASGDQSAADPYTAYYQQYYAAAAAAAAQGTQSDTSDKQ